MQTEIRHRFGVVRSVRRVALLSMSIGLAIGSSVLAQDQATTQPAAQEPVTLSVRVDQPGAAIPPGFYGLMTEEINYAYDGGLYAELIRNRILQDRPAPRRAATNPATTQAEAQPSTAAIIAATQPAPPPAPTPGPANLASWSLVTANGADGEMSIDTENPVNTVALKNSLRLDVRSAGAGGRVGVANGGYWGIPVKPDTEYTASFYARADSATPVTVSLEDKGGTTVYAKAQVPALSSAWQKQTIKLKTGAMQPVTDGRFVISSADKGSVWLSFVSLFPPTYKNRPNGMRVDLMELLAGLKPSFLRFPGGNYLEGSNFENRFDWKKTVGPLEERPGHMSPWGYRSTDGVGLLEFLNWCEDLNMEPVLAVYAGLHLDRGRNVLTGDALKPFVDEALEEIEYVTGDVNTHWGALRAKHGHPEPFKLRYVEIGNEDWLNNGKRTYTERFAMFYDAIKAKYPDLKVISSLRSQDKQEYKSQPDLLDDHYYVNIPTALANAHYYDRYDRKAHPIFVGEWATNSPGSGDVGHLAFALGDAAFMTGMERNADIIAMHCYAPLLVNVNPGGRQWQVNLIGYNGLNSFGSPAYYAQQMFANNRGDVVLPATFSPLPQLELAALPQAPGRTGGGNRPPAQAGPFDALFVSATRETASGDVILKLVNVQDRPQKLNVDLQGVATVSREATGQVLTGELTAMNSVDQPTNVAPKPITIPAAGPKFAHELPAHSVSLIRVKTK